MAWNPSKETQDLLRDPESARAFSDAMRSYGKASDKPREVTLPDGRCFELVLVEPLRFEETHHAGRFSFGGSMRVALRHWFKFFLISASVLVACVVIYMLKTRDDENIKALKSLEASWRFGVHQTDLNFKETNRRIDELQRRLREQDVQQFDDETQRELNDAREALKQLSPKRITL